MHVLHQILETTTHVTSLLHRTFTIKDGIMIYPTLTFDERGHNKNTVFYGALAKEMVNGKWSHH